MNNVHPIFKTTMAPIAPRIPAKGTRPFSIEITINGQAHELNVLAFTSCDAICRAIDIYFDGDEAMPETLKVAAFPMNLLAA